MIEKWTEENKDKWCLEIQETLKRYRISKRRIGYLLTNEYSNELHVIVEEPNDELKIIFNEHLRRTADGRNCNIGFIKQFVRQELPYYKFVSKTKTPEDEYGFMLTFKLKE